MLSPLEFVALSDAELQWLVAALQAVRSRFPWQALSLRAHDGAWILRVQGGTALYGEIASARARALTAGPANHPPSRQGQKTAGHAAAATVGAMPASTAMTAPVASQRADRLSLFMRDACKPWPPAVAERRNAGEGATDMRTTAKPVRPEIKNASEKHARDSGAAVKSALAKKGKYAGADWRGHSFALQDLRGADFSAADLRGADFHGANLQGAIFNNVQLGQSQAASPQARWRLPAYRLLLDKARFLTMAALILFLFAAGLGWLLQAGYAGASLSGLLCALCLLVLDQQHAGWRQKLANGGTRFDAANLQHADFSGARIGLVNFEQARLQQVRWHGATWQMPLYFSDPVLGQSGVPALLAGQRGQHDFSGYDLSAQNLSGLDLCGFDFSGANLLGANLCECNLQGARMAGANLCGANLSRSGLSGADLSGWKIDHHTGLAQVECDYWYDLPRGAGTCLPEAVPPERWPPDRWPPESGRLRPGEFVHLIAPQAGGIRFLAANLAQCQARLDLLLQLAKTMPLRLQQIHFDADPAAHGKSCLTILTSGAGAEGGQAATGGADGERSGQPETGYQIEVGVDASVDTLALCKTVWLCNPAPVCERDRLLDYLALLAC